MSLSGHVAATYSTMSLAMEDEGGADHFGSPPSRLPSPAHQPIARARTPHAHAPSTEHAHSSLWHDDPHSMDGSSRRASPAPPPISRSLVVRPPPPAETDMDEDEDERPRASRSKKMVYESDDEEDMVGSQSPSQYVGSPASTVR